MTAPETTGRLPGEFEITIPGGPMVCGYCDEIEAAWRAEPGAAAYLAVGYVALTGFHALGVGPAGELVVLAEAKLLDDRIVHLPHLCTNIPASKYEECAEEIAASLAERAGPPVGGVR